MDEQTTTEVPVETGGSQQVNGIPVDDQGQALPEPEETETTEAVAETTEEPSQDAPPAEEPAKEADNSNEKWLKSKGIDPNSPEAVEKLAEMARNSEQAMHSKAQKASELEKALDSGITQEAEAQGITDDDRLDIARIKAKLTVREFFDNTPDAKPYEQAMIAELQNKPHLAGDLESLYATAVYKSGNLDAVKSQGKREALESLAHKQQAAVPSGDAVNGSSMGSATITPANVDKLVAEHDVDWFIKNQAAINKAMAG